MSDPKPIYVIMRIDHGKDDYNYPIAHEELEDHYGFFTLKANADAIVDTFEAKDRETAEAEYQKRLTAYRKDLRAYDRREVELATLRAAGVKPSFSSLQKPKEPKLEPVKKERFYSSYEVRELELNGKEWPS